MQTLSPLAAMKLDVSAQCLRQTGRVDLQGKPAICSHWVCSSGKGFSTALYAKDYAALRTCLLWCSQSTQRVVYQRPLRMQPTSTSGASQQQGAGAAVPRAAAVPPPIDVGRRASGLDAGGPGEMADQQLQVCWPCWD